ncbi:MAG TPA: hypothetical protein VFJ90_07715, partial [Candidatus Didemnitutus sp.]|nr:hypothetical protein [Candidatus Didemnitutus sp.]
MEVRFNRAHLGHMTAPARYAALMHELAHLHYAHPGNQHPDSVLNETQADDTAVVNAMTLYPEEGTGAVASLADFTRQMEAAGHHGGHTHPDNPTRENRLRALRDAILEHATIEVHLESNFTPEAQMHEFLRTNGAALLIEPGDVKGFRAQNGNFCYLNGRGIVRLREYLDWLPLFHFRVVLNLIPGLRHSWRWVIRPVTVQNQFKDRLPGAIN